jgi:spermidine/putrescine transport system substrate-binding protein
VVFPSNTYVQPMRELGLLARLDHRRLPLLNNLEEQFQKPEWDGGLEWSVPYLHGATGVLYNPAVANPPLAWSDLWTDSYSRRLTMLDDPSEMFAACLKRLGCSLNSGQDTELKRARDLAVQQKPLVRAYLNGEARDQVVAGDILVAQMWTQIASLAMESSEKLRFAFPVEGYPLYADNACILRESKRPELAHEFLNYLLEPKVAAGIATEMRSATANRAARTLLPISQRNNAVLYPSQEVLARGEWFRPLPNAAQRLRDRYWTEIKSA